MSHNSTRTNDVWEGSISPKNDAYFFQKLGQEDAGCRGKGRCMERSYGEERGTQF